MPKEHHIMKSVVLRFAQKYVAGYTVNSVLQEIRENSNRGVNTAVTFLNEEVDGPIKARYNANTYVQLAKQTSRLNLNADMSVRLSQIGLNLNDGVLDRCLDDILNATKNTKSKVWLEAERGMKMQTLFDTYRKCRQDHANVGVEIPIWYPLEVETIRKNLRKNDMVKLTSFSYTGDIPEDGSFEQGYANNIKSMDPEGKVKGTAKNDGKPKRHKNTVDLYISSIGKLLQAGVSVVVLDHKEEVIAKLAGFSKEYKKSLIFELPLGYNKKWLAKLMKMKINLSVYAPYGRDWTPYIVNKLTARHDKIRDIAARALNVDAKSVIDGEERRK